MLEIGNGLHVLGNGQHKFITRVILIIGRLGWVICLSWPDWVRQWAACVLGNGQYVLGYGPQVLGNGHGLLVLGNGPHLLSIMSQFGIMSHSVLCCIRGYVVRHYVISPYVAFGIMSFGIMSHSALCHIRPYVVRLCCCSAMCCSAYCRLA